MPDAHECAHVDCVASEPDRMLRRKVEGTSYVETYCEAHDPLDDPVAARHFEAVEE